MNTHMLQLRQGARLFGIELSDAQLALFDLYQNELRLWSARTNLIAESTSGEIVTRHFLDSLSALPHIINQNARMIDIGSGAGFPGLALKIARPDLQIWLLESNRKKVSFLKHMIRLLNLSDIFTINDRTENLLKDGSWRSSFDFVISRAALKLPQLLPLGDYFLAPGGLLIAWKGPDLEDELAAVDKLKIDSLFCKLIQYDIDLPLLGPPRKIIIAVKPDLSKKAF